MIWRIVSYTLLSLPAALWSQVSSRPSAPEAQLTKEAPPGYIVGPGDQLTVDVTELEQFTGKTYRVDSDGSVSFPFAGRMRVGGLSLVQVETNLTDKLKDQVKEPHVLVSLLESRSQPVSILGSVNAPGMYQLQGGKRLFDVLSLAGGLRNEAGSTLRITRRDVNGPLPLSGATHDAASGVFTAEVSLHDLTENRNPALNITLAPQDVIDIPKADIIYVIGEVKKAGGFSISRRDVSALQALSMAEGLSNFAAPQRSRILRQVAGSSQRQEIQVDLKKLLAGQSGDVVLQPDDILFVPNNASRRVVGKVAEAALQTVSGLIIWRGI